MNWTRISRRTLPVDPVTLWELMTDLENWGNWDPDLSSAKLYTPLAEGATGFFVPSGGFRGRVHSKIAKPFLITAYDPRRVFGVRQPIPGGNMDLTFTFNGSELTQQVTLDGPLRRVLVHIIGGDIVEHFDTKCDRLTAAAKARDNA